MTVSGAQYRTVSLALDTQRVLSVRLASASLMLGRAQPVLSLDAKHVQASLSVRYAKLATLLCPTKPVRPVQ